MAKIVDYTIVEYVRQIGVGPRQQSLAEMVRGKIRDGFRPYGAPFTMGQHHTIVCQAMVKVEDDNCVDGS
jgi:hypothetical protein